MSGFLGEIANLAGFGAELAALRDLLGLSGLQPGSFRGVPFHVTDSDRTGGRRNAVHEFPLRDSIATEDLGRAKREFSVTAYVIGEDWQARRDKLLYACEDLDKPGTLTLPSGLDLAVRCSTVRVSETVRNVAVLTMSFVDAGGDQAGVEKTVDTAAALRSSVGRILRLARSGFALAYAVRDLGDLVQRGAASGLAALGEGFAASWLGLPGLDLAGTVRAIAGLDSADAGDPAAAVLAPSRALANAALAMPRASASSAAVDATTSRAAPPPSRQDVALALLRVATAPEEHPVVGPGVLSRRIEANRRALDALSRDAATLMAAEVLSATDFASVTDARTVRNLLMEAVDARAEVAADAGQDDAFRGWRDLAATAARDLTERARRAPRLAAYDMPLALPSLALSQRLYLAGGRADELVLLNDPPHPAFMPLAGQALRP